MNKTETALRRTTGLTVVVVCVLAGNFLLFLLKYGLPQLSGYSWVQQSFPFVGTFAVFPVDLFFTYLREFPFVHIWWMVITAVTAVGLLQWKALARRFFIILAVVNGVGLTYLVIQRYGTSDFLDYSFKLYFTLVVTGAYVGYLTLPDVREMFEQPQGSQAQWARWRQWLWRRTHAPDAQGYHKLALAYAHMGRFDDAMEFLDKAIALKSEDAELYYSLGMTFARQKRYAQAVSALQEAVNRNPLYPEAAYQLALVYRRQGCDAEAIPLLRKTAHLRPQDAVVLRELGEAYAAMRQPEEARAAFQQAAALNPQDGYVSYRLGYILFHDLQLFREAREAFQRAERYLGNNPDVHFQLGLLALQMDEPKKAVHAFKEVLLRQDQHRQARYQLGLAYIKSGDMSSARREMTQLAETDPELAESLRLMML